MDELKFQFKLGDTAIIKGNSEDCHHHYRQGETVTIKCLPIGSGASYDSYGCDNGEMIQWVLEENLTKVKVIEDMSTTKFKVGDRVEITGNTNHHEFNIGQIVKITAVALLDNEDYEAESLDDTEDVWYLRDCDIKGVIFNSKPSNMNTVVITIKGLVKSVADKLLLSNNAVTTLEVKNQLRSEFPNNMWNQGEISNIMDELHADGVYSYTDNGTYRVYFTPGQKHATSVLNNVAADYSTATKKVDTKATKITKSKALDLIKAHAGKFFTATFIKVTGQERTMNAMYSRKLNKDNSFGYIKVLTNFKSGQRADIRQINLNTLEQLNIGKEVYLIK